MLNNSTVNDTKDDLSASEWIQPSIGNSYVPVSNEKIIDGVYSATADDEIVILTEAGQSWFWTKEWQALESEADNDIAEGRFASHTSMDDFIADLDN